MTIQPKQYDVAVIRKRAADLHLQLLAVDGNIHIKMPKKIDADKKQILTVISEHKAALLASFDQCSCGVSVETDPDIGQYDENGQYSCSHCSMAAGDLHTQVMPETTVQTAVQGISQQSFIDRLAADPACHLERYTVEFLSPDTTIDDLRRDVERREKGPREKIDFWENVRASNARFDPHKSVDWTAHGFKRDSRGKWYDARSRD